MNRTPKEPTLADLFTAWEAEKLAEHEAHKRAEYAGYVLMRGLVAQLTKARTNAQPPAPPTVQPSTMHLRTSTRPPAPPTVPRARGKGQRYGCVVHGQRYRSFNAALLAMGQRTAAPVSLQPWRNLLVTQGWVEVNGVRYTLS